MISLIYNNSKQMSMPYTVLSFFSVIRYKNQLIFLCNPSSISNISVKGYKLVKMSSFLKKVRLLGTFLGNLHIVPKLHEIRLRHAVHVEQFIYRRKRLNLLPERHDLLRQFRLHPGNLFQFRRRCLIQIQRKRHCRCSCRQWFCCRRSRFCRLRFSRRCGNSCRFRFRQ